MVSENWGPGAFNRTIHYKELSFVQEPLLLALPICTGYLQTPTCFLRDTWTLELETACNSWWHPWSLMVWLCPAPFLGLIHLSFFQIRHGHLPLRRVKRLSASLPVRQCSPHFPLHALVSKIIFETHPHCTFIYYIHTPMQYYTNFIHK